MIPNKSKIEEIIKKLQEIMRIQDWDIILHLCDTAQMAYECEHPYVGYCTRFREHKLARVYINTNHNDNSGDGWYSTLVHELCHVVTDDYIFAVDTLCSDMIPKQIEQCVSQNLRIQYERLVQQLTKTFVTVYPVTNFIAATA